jgi:hypothetical protein
MGLKAMEDWERLLKGIGNLQALKKLWICGSVMDSHEELPDFETLARVLRHVRQKITLSVNIWETRRAAEGFARAIRGHPTIQKFETSDSFDDASLGLLLPALATLPALESIDIEAECVHACDHPEQLTTLLLSRSLRSVTLRDFDLTNAACQAVAGRSEERITCLAPLFEGLLFPRLCCWIDYARSAEKLVIGNTHS